MANKLKKKAAADYIFVSKRKLERLMAINDIGFIREGRTVYFLQEDLDDWIRKHRVKPKKDT